jgi:hypothetical protein
MRGFEMIDPGTPPSGITPAAPLGNAVDPWQGIVRTQVMLSLGLLLVFVGTCAAVEFGAHSETLGRWLQDRETSRDRRDDRLVTYTRNFLDAGDRLMLGDLPNLDTSKGGVYVLGSSAVLYCLEDWSLPPQQARLIHNFGFYSINPTQMLQFARFMTEHESLLSAGGNKTMIFIGLSLADMVEDDPDLGVGGARYLPACVERSGLYDYDKNTGISVIPMTRPISRLTYEKALCRSFLLRCCLGASGSHDRRPIDRAAFKVEIQTRLGHDWQRVMSRQLLELEQLFDYLQARQVEVVPFFVPRGSWTDDLPACKQFVAAVNGICQARHLPPLDYGHLLKDEEFSDPMHPAAEGTRKVHAAMMKIAMEYLHRKILEPEP